MANSTDPDLSLEPTRPLDETVRGPADCDAGVCYIVDIVVDLHR
jgi:hypothetical protein